MKTFLKNFYYSFPIQLLLLHFRKAQVLLIFWFILFLTLTGNFMKIFGANALFLAPEYLGNVNAAGAAITGTSAAVFIMSWNITTFILHSQRFRFLATNSKPFLKYCVNNSIIPICFLLVYFFTADRRIIRTFKPDLTEFDKHKKFERHEDALVENNFGLPVGYYLTTRFRFSKARKVGHYRQELLDI